MTFKCIPPESSSSAYRLSDLKIYTAWVTFTCIHTKWPWNAYVLSHNLKMLRAEWRSASYILCYLKMLYDLSHPELYTPWVTFKWLQTEWASVSYSLSDWPCLRVQAELPRMHTPWVIFECIQAEWSRVRTPWVISKCIRTEWLSTAYILGKSLPNTCCITSSWTPYVVKWYARSV